MSSQSGYVSIAAVVVLETPRPIDPQKGQRNLALDVNFYVPESTQMASLALLRYFASNNITNELLKIPREKPFQKAFIVANVCYNIIIIFSSRFYCNLYRYLQLHQAAYRHL